MDNFAERFKQLKEAQNLTYQNLADFLELNIRTIKGYAAGTIDPPSSKLIKLADFFDVSLDYLVGRTDKPNSHKI